MAFCFRPRKKYYKKNKAETQSGYNRINWDLSTESKLSLSLSEDEEKAL